MTWQQAASEALLRSYPEGMSTTALLAALEDQEEVPSYTRLAAWLRVRLAEGTVDWTAKDTWIAGNALMRPECAWDYSFLARPADDDFHPLAETARAQPGLRYIVTMTEAEFAKFRVRAVTDGLDLLGITRVPHAEPQAVR